MTPRLNRGEFLGKVVRRREVPGFILSETLYSPNAALPKHSHEHAYFTLVRQGGFTENIGSRARVCPPLTFSFHPPDETHSERFSENGGRGFNIEIESKSLRQLQRRSTALNSPLVFEKGRFLWLAARLYQEFRTEDDASTLAAEGLILETIAEADRAGVPPSPRRPYPWLNRTREILHDTFREAWSLADLAGEVGVHPVHLASEFRRAYDCTIGDYVRRLRVEFAGDQISSTELPLVEIALSAGFADQSHFCRIFKRVTGLTPAQFRDACRRP